MKTVIQKSIAAVIALASLQVLAATPKSSIDGTWTVVDRLCSDGQSAKDNFKLGRDTMTLEIQSWIARLEVVVPNYNEKQALEVDQKNHLIGGNRYDVDQNGRLAIYTSGFGPGGSCHEGQTLKTSFAKK